MAIARPLRMRAALFLGLVIIVCAGLFYFFGEKETLFFTQNTGPDLCISCHENEADMSRSHPVEAFGCYSCHLGNPQAADEKNAHAGMVRNPSDLHWAAKTCGKSGCHTDLTHFVKNSIMTSNSGLIAATLYQWDEAASPSDSLLHIAENVPDTSLATSHIRKLCAGCHINKKENDLPGEIGERGGGCNDCHLVKNQNPDIHPGFTVQIGNAVCEKCHNRSNRTALSYQGKFESEGYGTPYEAGNPSEMTLSGNRHYYHLTADVHFEAGMVCIDCHIAEDVMGDGRRYEHLEDQVHIQCADCHNLQTAKPDSASIIWKIISVNDHLAVPADSQFARTGRGSFYANVFREKGKAVLIRKMDGKRLPVSQNKRTVECNMAGHERMSCQSCHTAYTPQCYGCHDVYDPTRKQLDKITYEETDGHWTEGRSYLRFEKPALGLDKHKRVMPFAPGCQVYLTELDDQLQIKQQKTWLTMAPFDPHITRRAVAPCIDCHGSMKRLGLGEGSMHWDGTDIQLEQLYNSEEAGLGKSALEQMVDVNDESVQRMSRLKARPFSIDEIKKIYRVSLCITCHDRYDDVIYKNYRRSVQRYRQEQNLPCRREN